MKKKTTLLFLLLCALLTISAADYYDTGYQFFKISVGFDVPFTNTFKKDGKFQTSVGPGIGEGKTHFNLGGYGSLDYEVFTTPKIAIGGEIGYQFNYAAANIFTQVPMLFKATYIPVQGKFEVPLSAGIGFNYMSYNEASMLSPMVTLEAGASFFVTDNWGFGLTTGIQATAELYRNTDKNGFATFIPANFVATYRH